MSCAAASRSAESSMIMASLPPISAMTRLTQRWFSICWAASSFMRKPVFIEPVKEIKRVLADRKSTRLNSSHANISYAVFCLNNKNIARSGLDVPAYGHTVVGEPPLPLLYHHALYSSPQLFPQHKLSEEHDS